MRRLRASRPRRVVAVAATAALALPVLMAPQALAAPSTALADQLVSAVTAEGINRHLIAFQRIADRTGGQRTDTTPGFRQSFEYVEGKVRAAGFDVSVEELTYDRTILDAAYISASTSRFAPINMAGSPNTPVGGITGTLVVVPADATTGCEAADYAGTNAVGAIALIRRGGCTFTQKQQVAADAGAAAAVVYNYNPGPMGGSVDPQRARIPIVGLAGGDGIALRALAGTRTTLEMRAHDEPTVSRNLIAQTRTGRTDNVIMAGAHLDSAPGTPGLNENASSVAALLETALQLGHSPAVNNAVRFSWWGADWANTGSAAYLAARDFEEQLNIALYLEFEAIAAPNGGYFVYDGDNSDGVGAGGPYGSKQIETAFAGYLGSRGLPTEGTNFPGRGAHSDFIEAGIPTGGLFSGLFYYKSQAQAAKWGGQADVPFDPCNHAPCDNLGNINRVILDRNADAIAFITGTYATSTEDVNGVPSRSQRAAARAAAKSQAAVPAALTS